MTDAISTSNFCLHQLFEIQVELFPNAIAIEYEQEKLTYAQLNQKANQLAHYLMQKGVKAEIPVGLYLERSVKTIIGMLGIIKAGGAYVPLDPDYPQERLNYILEDTQISFLVSQSSLIDKINYSQETILLDKDEKILEQQQISNPDTNVKPENLLYIIYTSGSTGKPKGVMVNHESVVDLFARVKAYFDFNHRDVWTFFHSYSFGFSVWEIWGALLHGGKLVIVPSSMTRNPKAFYDLLYQQKVTILSQTATAFRLLVHGNHHYQPDSLSLRYIIFSGETIEPYLLKFWIDIYGDNQPQLVNMYALTETSGEVTYKRFRKEDLDKSNKNIVGIPLGDVQIHILDENMKPMSTEETGEIYIGGKAVARGYFNQPELTVQKFIPNPFDKSDKVKLYKTGDIGKYLSNGEIEFVGREDDQVKIRGYRIELGEIEAKLAQHPQVRESVVNINQNEGNKQLIAYIVPQSQQIELSQKTLTQTDELEIWPSLGEYNIYDDLLYYIMGEEASENSGFIKFIKPLVKNKIIVDVGTGQEAIFARLCVEFGAKKVYGIELLESAAQKATTLVKNLNLEEKIQIIQGDSTTVNLPEKSDIAISRIFGNIGSSDGVVNILNDARRFLKEDGEILPQQCLTKIAAVSLPDNFRDNPQINSLASYYFQKTFESIGYPFDVRLCVRNFPTSNIISNVEVFENLDFSSYVKSEYDNEGKFIITKNGIVDGFLLWVNLAQKDKVIVDYLEYQSGWLPVFFPVFDSGVAVVCGDMIKARWNCQLSENGINPDYKIKGQLIKQEGEIINFEFESFHKKPIFKHNYFYKNLFGNRFNQVQVVKDNQKTELTPKDLHDYLKKSLPDYMLPNAFIFINELPLSANGKLNRQALPQPKNSDLIRKDKYMKPNTDLEKDLIKIWQEVLKIQPIGIHDNFFELGGNSIQVMEFSNEIQALWQDYVYITAVFEAPTVAELASYLCENYQDTVSRLYSFQTLQHYGIEVENDISSDKDKIDESKVKQMRQLIPVLPNTVEKNPKNPPIGFILSPPRSGSTLLRVILAGHPQLFAPPELELLSFKTLKERKDTYSGQNKFWFEGTLKAIMELKKCDLDKARQIMSEYESKNLSVIDFYAQMQNWLGERILIDKSPYYTLYPQVLEKAENNFESPFYIHLTRHPYGMIQSYEEIKLKFFFPWQHPFSDRQLAELFWLISHQNIVEFLQKVPPSRQYQVKFEDLVQDTENTLKGICEFLQIDYHPQMAKPYQYPENRMIEPIHSHTVMLGDLKFNQHKQVNPNTAYRWQENLQEDFLGDITWEMAQKFGYDRQVVSQILSSNQEKLSIQTLLAQSDAEELTAMINMINELEEMSEKEASEILNNQD